MDPSPGADEIKVALGVLHRAESTFVLAWEECTAAAQSMKRACMLTAILSFFVFACGGMQLLRGMAFEKSTGIGLIAGVMTEVLVYFAFGLLVCAVLYAAYDLFEGALSYRKARWDYFCACAKDDLFR